MATETLLVEIKAKYGDFTRGIDQAKKEAAKLSGDMGMFDKVATRANSTLGALGMNAELTGAQLATMGKMAGAAGVLAMAAGAAKAVDIYRDLAGWVTQVQRITGSTAEESSRLVQVFERFGVDQSNAGQGLQQIAGAIAENEDAFASYGVTVARNADGTVNLVRTLEEVAGAYADLDDPARKAALAQKAFGEDGALVFLPLLTKGAQGFREEMEKARSATVLSDEDLERAEDLKAAMVDAQDAVQALAVIVGEQLVPYLTEAAKRGTMVADLIGNASDLLPGGLDMGDLFGEAFRSISPMTAAAVRASDAVHDLYNELTNAGGSSEWFGDTVASAADGLDRLTGGVEGIAARRRRREQASDGLAAIGQMNATGNAASAAQELAAAQDALNDATSDLDRARRDSAARAEAAERGYAAAVRSSEQALRNLGDAQERLQDLRQEMASGLTEERAKLRVLEAEEALQDALSRQGSGDPFQETSARVAEQEAVIALQEAQQALADVQAGTSDEMRDAEDAVRDAQDAYAASTQAVRDAAQAQRDAATGASEWADAVEEAAARKELASERVRDALQAEADAYEILRAAQTNASMPFIAAGTKQQGQLSQPFGGSPSFINAQTTSADGVTVYVDLSNNGITNPVAAGEEVGRQVRFATRAR